MNVEQQAETQGHRLAVIVQAGGRGSRLRHHTWNKPKCLVSVRGKPLLFHVLHQLGDADFFIVGDYLHEKIEQYLAMNPPGVRHTLIRAEGKGTASGIRQALERTDPQQPVLLLWSDLILHETPEMAGRLKPVVYTTAALTCRWSVNAQGEMEEKTSSTSGIPGVFYFPRARMLHEVPAQGEFVRWYASTRPDCHFVRFDGLEELGDFASIEQDNARAGFCRFFNRVEMGEQTVTKTVVVPEYAQVHEHEKAWYRAARELGFKRMPRILQETPLVMERIRGQHVFDITDLSAREQRAMLSDYLESLNQLHERWQVPTREVEVAEVYLNKTQQRVQSVLEVIPHIDKRAMTINGRKCRNFFHPQHAPVLEALLPTLMPQSFCAIHGDPTYSNTLVDDKLRVWFIDPRGYFHQPGIEGDAGYDFAKLYYSAVGGYDAFNRKQFKLHVDEETVEVLMERPRYAQAAQEVLGAHFGGEMRRIRIIHALIWFALSGYAKDDMDSIIAAFYLGNYWLESALGDRAS